MAHRPVVVKLGSSLVVGEDGAPRLDTLAAVTAAVAGRDHVAIVSSGAIALGRGKAGRPSSRLPYLQAASALGQADLQRLWQDAFATHSLHVAQVLLAASDITERRSYVNAREALNALFAAGAVPVINENDATATDEIGFGDNDVLAAQTAVLLRAERLVLLTAAGGILSAPPGAGGEVVADGDDVDESMFGPASPQGRGGVESKVAAARLAAAGGVETFVAEPSSLGGLLAGGRAGTRFAPRPEGEPAFKLWLRYGKRMVSRVTIDDGAVEAIRHGGASLLAVGVVEWSPSFRAGDGILVQDRRAVPVAHAIASADAAALSGRPRDLEVAHRDRLALV
jgi:glutamate 5-kinase